MRDENTLVLTGRLTKDPLITTKPGDKCHVKFGLAVNVSDDKAYFLNCMAYDGLAQFIGDNFRKGDWVFTRGYIRQYDGQDETSGRPFKYYDVVIHRIHKLQSKINS